MATERAVDTAEAIALGALTSATGVACNWDGCDRPATHGARFSECGHSVVYCDHHTRVWHSLLSVAWNYVGCEEHAEPWLNQKFVGWRLL